MTTQPTDENPYDELAKADVDGHWAFGTGFTDPLAGVDRSVPDGVDRDDLAEYCLMLGDDALVYAQRLAHWCSRAPELEEDVALANIALDLLGQARLLLSRAAEVRGAGDEDTLAYFREAAEFRNVRLAEVDTDRHRGDGELDFAAMIARLLVFATCRLSVLARLADSRDPVLAGVAAKGVKELAYHRDHAVQWTLRLAGGTDYSRERMTAGLAAVWPYVAELFAAHPVEQRLAAERVAVDPGEVWPEVDGLLSEVLAAARLEVPEPKGALDTYAVPEGTLGPTPRGRSGDHTDDLRGLLSEMQSLARAMPEATW